MIERFGNGQHNEFVDWIQENPNGYVWYAKNSTLHTVSCYHVQKYGLRVPLKANEGLKEQVSDSGATIVCASTNEELYSEIPQARSSEAHCSACRP